MAKMKKSRAVRKTLNGLKKAAAKAPAKKGGKK